MGNLIQMSSKSKEESLLFKRVAEGEKTTLELLFHSSLWVWIIVLYQEVILLQLATIRENPKPEDKIKS